MNPEYINVPCPLCGEEDFFIRYTATRATAASPSSEQFRCTSDSCREHENIVQCRRCALLFTNPQPSPEALRRVYAEVIDPKYVEQESARVATFARMLREIEQLCPRRGRLLDFGCCTGVFMDSARSAGWDV